MLRFQTTMLNCILVACHAPHTGQDLNHIEQWWQTTTDSIPNKYKEWPIVLLTDANAKVGQHLSANIGDLDAEHGGDKAEPFEDFVVRLHHHGSSRTWTHSQGHQHRLDYVAIPRQWEGARLKSWVQDDFETPLPRDDHAPVHLQLRMDIGYNRKFGPSPNRHTQRLTVSNTANLEAFSLAPDPTWTLDVHQHAELLQDQLATCLPRNTATTCCEKTITSYHDF